MSYFGRIPKSVIIAIVACALAAFACASLYMYRAWFHAEAAAADRGPDAIPSMPVLPPDASYDLPIFPVIAATSSADIPAVATTTTTTTSSSSLPSSGEEDLPYCP